jgi:adenosylhomocysteine nucleosidase
MTIGIMGAMDQEIQLYKNQMDLISETNKAGIVYYEGMLNGKKVVLCKSGVGKVNASVCTQIMIDRFNVDCVIFTGVAGALHPEHDMDASPLGFAKGEIPFADTSLFKADEKLVKLAVKASEALGEGNTFVGRVLSGDQFIANREIVKQLYEQMEGTCTEMEGAAVAQVCHMNQVPFVIIRSMSDKADGSAHVNFEEFTNLASQRSFQIVYNMLELM